VNKTIHCCPEGGRGGEAGQEKKCSFLNLAKRKSAEKGQEERKLQLWKGRKIYVTKGVNEKISSCVGFVPRCATSISISGVSSLSKLLRCGRQKWVKPDKTMNKNCLEAVVQADRRGTKKTRGGGRTQLSNREPNTALRFALERLSPLLGQCGSGGRGNCDGGGDVWVRSWGLRDRACVWGKEAQT